MEIWHWTATKMTYAVAAYWYAHPAAGWNRACRPDEVQRPIEQLRNRVAGVLEGEELRIKNKTGGVTDR